MTPMGEAVRGQVITLSHPVSPVEAAGGRG
jgi:hypothetical protein